MSSEEKRRPAARDRAARMCASCRRNEAPVKPEHAPDLSLIRGGVCRPLLQ
jgi:hypothetical protein